MTMMVAPPQNPSIDPGQNPNFTLRVYNGEEEKRPVGM
jgi:hypothetical protein